MRFRKQCSFAYKHVCCDTLCACLSLDSLSRWASSGSDHQPSRARFPQNNVRQKNLTKYFTLVSVSFKSERSSHQIQISFRWSSQTHWWLIRLLARALGNKAILQASTKEISYVEKGYWVTSHNRSWKCFSTSLRLERRFLQVIFLPWVQKFSSQEDEHHDLRQLEYSVSLDNHQTQLKCEVCLRDWGHRIANESFL